MVYTTYFANLKKLPDNIIPIAICGKVPDFYKGLCYKKLAPKLSFFKVWKETKDNDYYIANFNKLVLDKLNPQQVLNELMQLSNQKDVALICYEKSSDFCHRHLVADWFKKNDIECQELIF